MIGIHLSDFQFHAIHFVTRQPVVPQHQQQSLSRKTWVLATGFQWVTCWNRWEIFLTSRKIVLEQWTALKNKNITRLINQFTLGQSVNLNSIYKNWQHGQHFCDRDKKCDAIETSQFRLHHLVHQNVHRQLAIQGQQLTIEGCSRSLITVSGYSDSVFVDDCSECKMILGPVKGRYGYSIPALNQNESLEYCHRFKSFQFFSVFLRNCRECLVVSACGQFRTRDCTGITCYLFCPSQPSLETSTSFWFHCLSLDYPQFRGILD